MIYLTLHHCRAQLFPYIRERMAMDEPAPSYQYEQSGINRLESILALMQRDEYVGVLGKAAYLFCSVIDSHPFSNGNKRLAVTMLIAFLLVNDYKIHGSNMEALREALQETFPNVKWQRVKIFTQPHEHFFYHLALIIADRAQKGGLTFAEERTAVESLLGFIAMR
jgi:death-on-curing family protein